MKYTCIIRLDFPSKVIKSAASSDSLDKLQAWSVEKYNKHAEEPVANFDELSELDGSISNDPMVELSFFEHNPEGLELRPVWI